VVPSVDRTPGSVGDEGKESRQYADRVIEPASLEQGAVPRLVKEHESFREAEGEDQLAG
jgi:hypothetical protein